eukprot:364279-Chlamydomonas_euryale.AAC.2
MRRLQASSRDPSQCPKRGTDFRSGRTAYNRAADRASVVKFPPPHSARRGSQRANISARRARDGACCSRAVAASSTTSSYVPRCGSCGSRRVSSCSSVDCGAGAHGGAAQGRGMLRVTGCNSPPPDRPSSNDDPLHRTARGGVAPLLIITPFHPIGPPPMMTPSTAQREAA